MDNLVLLMRDIGNPQKLSDQGARWRSRSSRSALPCTRNRMQLFGLKVSAAARKMAPGRLTGLRIMR